MKLDIQQLIGNTLRRGVTLACLLAALGGLYYLVTRVVRHDEVKA